MRVAACKQATRCFGNSLKFVLWLQGCPRACPGCMAPEWRAATGGQDLSVATLHDLIMASGGEGLVVSGGEPLLQYAELCELLTGVRRKGRGVIVYTGFTEAEVQRRFAQILSLADILIPEPYMVQQNDGGGLRGSSNQPVRFLTQRYVSETEYFNAGKRAIEVEVEADYMIICGVPPIGLAEI